MPTFDDGNKASKGRAWGGMRRRKVFQIELSDAEKKEKYDVWAALAKALLVFMVSFGSVGGFLNAYGIKYNWVACVAGLGVLALLLAFVYETEKKWFTNLCVIGIFIVYAYVAVKRFWVLNSGAYAVINEIYEAAQNYLGVSGGGLYSLQINDSYQTVTGIALFVGVVLEILMVIRLQYKASLVRTVLLTFTLYLVPIYFEKTPDSFCFFLLLSGYVTIGILQCGKVKKRISRQIKQALPAGTAIAACIVLTFTVLLPKSRYRTMVPKNPVKEATEESAVAFAQYGIMALFMNGSAGGGLNEGQLSQNAMVMPTNKTDLIVRFTPYAMAGTYLKAFTGLDYDGRRWSKATEVLGEEEDKMRLTAEGRRTAWQEDPQIQPRGIMEVFNVDAAQGYEYRPYYTDLDGIERVPSGELPEEAMDGMRYVYYPRVGNEEVDRDGDEEVDERYLTVPVVCRRAVTNACKEANLGGTPEEIVRQLTRYFDEHYSYTLRPGYYFGGMDYVSYFLSRNKKGYCTHFASAGTMMLRNMGIPARYVEGYVFSYTDVVTDGEIVEGAEYSDYYDGYSPLGDTALVEVPIPDAQAHAWIEAYFEELGWVVVDVTPAAALEEEETESFWDAFLGGGVQGGGDVQNQQAAAQYFENALAGTAWLFIVFVSALAIFFLTRWGLVQYRESKLPGKERVQLEYGRLTAWLKERDEAFLTLTTPQEELDFMEAQYGVAVPKDLKEELYGTFFAPERDRDYQLLRTRILELGKAVKSAKRRK